MIENIKKYLKQDDWFEYDDYHRINNDEYEYIWGGCLYDKKQHMITKYINKAGTMVADVRYTPCIFGGLESFEVNIENRFMGYITQDYKFSAPMGQGAGYWLEGILKSMEIVTEREEAKKRAKAEWEESSKNLQLGEW